VIAGKGTLLTNGSEKAPSIQVDFFHFPMADMFCPHDGGPKGVADGLVAKTDPQDGAAARKMPAGLHAYPRILRTPRAGGNDQMAHIKGFQPRNINFIIPDNRIGSWSAGRNTGTIVG
jgi:hypothetical protein